MLETLHELWWLFLLLLALAAWIRFAEHPTASTLRRAIAATLDL
jgi:hypothetical protein